MAKSYQELMQALRKEEIDVDYDHVPEELGAFREPPQPGSFRFQCPQAIENCFGDPIEVKQKDAQGNVVNGPDGKPATRQRIQLVFDGPNSLTIVQSPQSKYDNEAFSTRISNVERPRFVSKNVKMNVSDMTYLLRAKAPDARPKLNEEFVAACLRVLPSAQFGADVEWSGYCNPDRDAIFAFEGEKGEVIYEPAREEGAAENHKGCGERIYNNKWPREKGVYAERAQCKCGAWLRPYPQLCRFKA